MPSDDRCRSRDRNAVAVAVAKLRSSDCLVLLTLLPLSEADRQPTIVDDSPPPMDGGQDRGDGRKRKTGMKKVKNGDEAEAAWVWRAGRCALCMGRPWRAAIGGGDQQEESRARLALACQDHLSSARRYQAVPLGQQRVARTLHSSSLCELPSRAPGLSFAQRPSRRLRTGT